MDTEKARGRKRYREREKREKQRDRLSERCVSSDDKVAILNNVLLQTRLTNSCCSAKSLYASDL